MESGIDGSARCSIVVTGAAGFLGSAILREFQKDPGVPVVGLARSASAPGLVAADLAHETVPAEILKNAGTIIHAAGRAHQFQGAPRGRFHRDNVEVTRRLMQAAVQAGVGHVILISSVSVYPLISGSRKPEDELYGWSKLEAENEARLIAERTSLRLTILRLGTTFGEHDPGNVYRLIRALDSRRFVWLGRGTNRKSLIHREDVARACRAVAATPGTGVETFDLAGHSATMKQIVQWIAEPLGRRVLPFHIPVKPVLSALRPLSGIHRISRLRRTIEKWVAEDVYDDTAFRSRFAFEPVVDLRTGLEQEVRWYRGKRT